MEKLHISLIFSKLEVTKPIVYIITRMHNFIVKFGKILDIFKKFAGNRVNDLGNMPRRGVVPKFSDLEVLALSATAEVFGIDSENYLFHRLKNECPDRFPNLITRRQYNQRRKLTYSLGEEIRKDIVSAMDGGEDVFSIDSKPIKVCQNARAARCAMGKDAPELAPAWGYCASQGMHYYGYKLHAVCGITGVIHSYDTTAANVSDIHYLQDVKWQYSDCLMLGDKGYLSTDIQQNLFDVAHISLEVPYRLNQKNWRPPYNTPRFSDRHNYGGMTNNRYICKKEENQNGKTIEIYSFFQGESRRGSAQGNGATGVAGQEIWRGTLENYRMEERVA